MISLLEPEMRNHRLRKLKQGELVRIADVDGQMFLARREQVEPSDEVVHMRARVEVVDAEDAMSCSSRCSHRCEPRNPAPPVTTAVDTMTTC
jgi:hypothetical protein